MFPWIPQCRGTAPQIPPLSVAAAVEGQGLDLGLRPLGWGGWGSCGVTPGSPWLLDVSGCAFESCSNQRMNNQPPKMALTNGNNPKSPC